MEARLARNLIAAMIVVLVLLTLLSLGGCATVSVTTPDGMSIETKTLWKDISAAEASTEDMVLSLGSSSSADDARTLLAICLLMPEAEGCP